MILLWLDLETTGLDADEDFILECAWTITDVHLAGDGIITNRVVRPGWGAQARMDAIEDEDSVAYRMHMETGLWGELTDDVTDKVMLSDLEQLIIGDLLKAHGPLLPGEVRLAGASVHFDLGFVRNHMPKLASGLSHRVYDTSTLKALAEGIKLTVPDVPNAHPHRAAYDVMEALAWATSFGNAIAAAPKLEQLQFIAGYQAAAEAFEGYIENLRQMADPRQHVTVGSIIQAMKKSATSFRDRADLGRLHLDD